MAFDTEFFFKHGLSPFFGNMGDTIAMNLRRQMGQEQHQQSMKEMQEQYRLREEEQRRGYEFDTLLNQQREKLLEKSDLIERNQALTGSSLDVRVAELKSKIHMKQTKYEEGLKHKYAMEEDEHRYQLMKDLEDLKSKDPNKYTELVVNSIAKSAEALKDLTAMEALNQDSIMELTGIMNSADERITQQERDFAGKRLGALQKQLDNINNIRQTLTQQLREFDKQGKTDQGIVPDDRQGYLLKMVDILEDEMSYKGTSLTDMPGNEIIAELNRLAQESGAEITFTPADLKFLVANIWDSFKTGITESFKKPSQDKRKRIGKPDTRLYGARW